MRGDSERPVLELEWEELVDWNRLGSVRRLFDAGSSEMMDATEDKTGEWEAPREEIDGEEQGSDFVVCCQRAA